LVVERDGAGRQSWQQRGTSWQRKKKCQFFKKNYIKCMYHDFLGVIYSMRKPRNLKQGVRYHVIARANRDEMIFGSRALKFMFLDVVKKAQEKYKFVIQNFCVMGTHVHFILQPLKGESLSRIMQWILSVFAMQYNRTFNYKGHVFYDRFKSKIINNFRQYVATHIYIMDNPVKAGIVKKPGDFEFNGVSFMRKGLYEIIDPPDTMMKLIIPGLNKCLISEK
jgi:REP element-mobilizing transposase RayT